MQFTLLGTGTPSPSGRRQSAGYLIEADDHKIVIDHGGGAFQRLIELGIKAQDITALIVSHLHSDHSLDIPRLVLTRWDQGGGRAAPLRVFGPAPIRSVFDRLFGPHGAFAPDIRARCEHPASLAIFAARGGAGRRAPPAFELTEVSPGERFAIGGIDVEVGRARHFEPLLDCLCFRFRGEGVDIVYGGDTGHSEPVADFARGCGALVAMCQYLDGTPLPQAARDTAASHLEVAAMAARAQAGLLVLTHLSEQFDDPIVRAMAHQAMSGIYAGPIIWGEDKMRLDFARGPKAARFD